MWLLGQPSPWFSSDCTSHCFSADFSTSPLPLSCVVPQGSSPGNSCQAILTPQVTSPGLLALKTISALRTPRFLSQIQTSAVNSTFLYPTAYLTSPLGCLMVISNLAKPKTHILVSSLESGPLSAHHHHFLAKENFILLLAQTINLKGILMPKFSLCTPVPNWILETEFLDEVEKNSFIALPGKGGHSGRMPSKQCVPTLGSLWGVL